MRQDLRYSIFLLFLLASLPAFASAGQIRFTQSNSGAITATISFAPCPIGLLPGSGEPPTVVLAANQFTITSPSVVADALLPASACPPQTPPYSVSASLGNVPDGHYTANWIYVPEKATADFVVSSGLLRLTDPAPALNFHLLFALTLFLISMAIPYTQPRVNKP